jgi:hypothetical protein
MIHLWMAPLLLAVPATVNPAQAFGRLEHRPAHCRVVVGGRSLACERLQISTSWVRFDARGLPKGLPATRMAQGRCLIDANTVSCESHSRNVAGMSAEAQL